MDQQAQASAPEQVAHPEQPGHPTPDRPDIRNVLMQAKAALEASSRSMTALGPYVKAIEYLEREITRAYQLAETKIGAREHDYDNDKHLQDLRKKLLAAIETFQGAHENLILKN
jgi:hypothetical protein